MTLSGAEAAPVHLMILGDSLAAGYGLPKKDGFQAKLAAALKAQGVDVVLVDAAVSGDTTTDAAARLDWVLGGGPVDAAIVELGGNDALRALDPSLMVPQDREMVEDLILAAHADARAKVDRLAEEKMQAVTAGLPLPPGMKLPF